MEKDRKFFFDMNIFDPPETAEPFEDFPLPPPTFSEDELAAARDMAFEQGRQQGQKEQKESREQYVAHSLEIIGQNFSKLFAAETLRENIFEKESLKLAVMALDILFPELNTKVGHNEIQATIEKTLTSHKKTKEITISVPIGMKLEIEALIARLRQDEHDSVLWRVSESADMANGDYIMEWSDGGAVRDSAKAANAIRDNILEMLGENIPKPPKLDHSEEAQSIVLSKGLSESPSPCEEKEENEKMTGDES